MAAKRKKKAAAGRSKPAAAKRPAKVKRDPYLAGIMKGATQPAKVNAKLADAAFRKLNQKPITGPYAAEALRRRTAKRLNAEANAKEKALAGVLAKLHKSHGEASVMLLANQDGMRSVVCVPTGWQELDDVLTGDIDALRQTIPGSGRGWPRGRLVEVFGPESSGKTTLTLELIAAFQRQRLTCAFIDAEHALDTEYAQALGVNMGTLLMSQPDSGEEALNLIESMVDTKAVDVIVVDSVANLVPEAELAGEMGDAHVGLQARMMSQALRKLTGKVARSGVILIFINQIRMRIVRFGNPETTSGGGALKFYASVRLDIRNQGQIKKSNRVIGKRSRIRVIKNKVAAPMRAVYVDIEHGRGFTNMVAEYDPEAKQKDDDDSDADIASE